MDDLGSICWPVAIVSLLFTIFFSFVKYSLLTVSWPGLEDALEAEGKTNKLVCIRNKISRYIVSANLISLLFVLIFSITITVWKINPIHTNSLSNPSTSVEVTENIVVDIDDTTNNLKYDNDFRLSFQILLAIFTISFVSLSIFHIALPQMLASCWGTGIIVFSLPVMKYVDIVFTPVIIILFCIENILKQIAGMTDEDSPEVIEKKQEELLSFVEEGEKQGYVDEEQRDMIESVLEFRGTTAGEIMTPRTEMCSINFDLGFDDVVSFIIQEGHSRYPVYTENIDNITGMLYAKDLLLYLSTSDRPDNIEPILREAFYVPETKSLRDLLHDFKEKKVHVAVVLDEYGGTAGLVSFEDILEEIVGEIEDEHEQPRSVPVKIIDDRTFEVDARTEIYELNDQYKLKLPEDEDYETLGGFAFSLLGHIPMIGETFSFNGYSFTVIDAEKRKINRLRIEIIQHEENSQEL